MSEPPAPEGSRSIPVRTPGGVRWMSEQLPRGRYLHCPDGSHLAQFDDPGHYFPGLIEFLTSL